MSKQGRRAHVKRAKHMRGKEADTKFKRSDFVGKFSVKNIGIREGDKLMTEPTKDELLNELKRYETYNEQYHMRSNDVILYALRLAANLPSKGEIERIIEKYVYESCGGELQQTDVAAKLILERIRSVK